LSRACLGKMMHFTYKWHRKKWRFFTQYFAFGCPDFQSRLDTPGLLSGCEKTALF
jgi:hypothetical protein